MAILAPNALFLINFHNNTSKSLVDYFFCDFLTLHFFKILSRDTFSLKEKGLPTLKESLRLIKQEMG